MLELFTDGLTWAELWTLLWPGAVGAGLLLVGAVLVIGYVRHVFAGPWAPHRARLAYGAAAVVASVPLFLLSAHRVETKAADVGVPVVTLLIAIAHQLGLGDVKRGRARRR